VVALGVGDADVVVVHPVDHARGCRWIITTSFAPGEIRNRALLLYGGVGAGGFTLGMVAGGLLTTAGWRWVFFEAPGVSTFVLDGGDVYHCSSAYARGLDALWGMWQWLDRAPLGRNEDGWSFRRHDEYPDDGG
jgi:MFS family permease